MDRLHTQIAELLSEHGRIPPAEAEGLVDTARAEGHGEAWFWAEVDAIAAADPKLASRRRLVVAIRNRIQLLGDGFDAEHVVERHREQAQALGWSGDHLRALVAQLGRELGVRAASGPSNRRRTGNPLRERAVLIAGSAILFLVVIAFAVLRWTVPAGPDDPQSDARASESASSAGTMGRGDRNWMNEIRTVLEDLEYAATFEGAVDEETRRLMALFERGDGDAVAGPQLLAVLRRGLRDAEAPVWRAVSREPSLDSMQRFLMVYPDGEYSTRAAARLDELREGQARAQRVRQVQEQLVRLGREIDVSGELDAATLEELAVLHAALERDGVPEISPALVEELRSLDHWPRRAGDVFSECAGCPYMVVVPAGRFRMGSPSDEPGSEANERPVHEVRVPKFALGRTEVTFEQWAVCVEDGGCDFVPPDQGWGREGRPVINVSWADALAYLRWLSRRTGHDYRLPTESEWEYAARAGTSTRFHTGACITSEQANFDGRRPSRGCPESVTRRQTVPAASFPPNAFGLFDMVGNVREWTRDCWNDDYLGAPSDGSAWLTGDCSRPVLRGGSWQGTERSVRSANRTRPSGAFTDARTGFRPARDLEPVPLRSAP
ncbi:MAG: formylglycine-generating enzyme family protein [Candidatus Wenzhouxiangella sp. M2_3B_020]